MTYTFTASRPGTYLYHSGTQHELQVEMGLAGRADRPADRLRPGRPGTWRAYDDPVSDHDSSFGHEWLFVLSEMDPRIHDKSRFYGPAGLTGTDYLTNYFPNYFFMNGRDGAGHHAGATSSPGCPPSPTAALPQMHPGETCCWCGWPPSGATSTRSTPTATTPGSSPGTAGCWRACRACPGPDITPEVFTIQAVPGETVDGLFTWTGKGLNWDIYGTGPDYAHDCVDNDGDGYDDTTLEWCADHGKPFPVVLPENQNLTFGAFYSGSPFLGTMGALPPGEGGLNPYAGYTYMWHSHTEKELINFGIFPGGMLTMLIIQPHGVPITE